MTLVHSCDSPGIRVKMASRPIRQMSLSSCSRAHLPPSLTHDVIEEDHLWTPTPVVSKTSSNPCDPLASTLRAPPPFRGGTAFRRPTTSPPLSNGTFRY